MSDDPKVQVVTLEKKKKKRSPGRPPKIPIRPTDDKSAQLVRNKKRHISGYGLIEKIEDDPNSLDVLDEAMRELAVEAGSLDFERTEAERKGENTAKISNKKITSLKAVIDTYLKKRESIIDEAFDFRDKKFQKLFEFWIKQFRACCESVGMPEEQIEQLFQKAGEIFDDWEDDAMRYVKKESSI